MSIKSMKIYCVQCRDKVDAVLIYGKDIYKNHKPTEKIPFFQCPVCKNHVGCHHKTKNKTKPLGIIPNQELRNARKLIHMILDPMWQVSKNKRVARTNLYSELSKLLGYEYHTAEVASIEEARLIYKLLLWKRKTGNFPEPDAVIKTRLKLISEE